MNSKLSKALLAIITCLSIWYLDLIPVPNNYIPKNISLGINSIRNHKIWNSPIAPSDREDFRKSYLKSHLEASEIVWKRYVQKRRDYIGPDVSRVNPWPPNAVMYFWDYFLPTFSCPYTIERIGTLGDGGKWVCGFELFENEPVPADGDKSLQGSQSEDPQGIRGKGQEPCVVYSFGVAYESSFEAEFLKRTNCQIFAYDASVNGMAAAVGDSNPRVHFHKMFIGVNDTSEGKTLGWMMKTNGHKWIDFLKMDVEGAEIEVLKQVINEFEILPFAQLHLEIHGDQNGTLFTEVYKLWEQLESKGMRAFKNEINHWPCVRARLRPIYIEYSFINLKGNHRLVS